MPVSAAAGAGSTTSPITHTGLTPLMHLQVAVNHLCETIWLPLGVPRTCSPRFNPFRPSLLLPGRAVLRNAIAAKIDLCCCCFCCCCSPPPTCPPVRARAFPCCCVPVPLRPRASQQRDISTCTRTCSCPCTSTCHSPTPARLRHFLECRRIRADVCGVDEWRGSSTSRAP